MLARGGRAPLVLPEPPREAPIRWLRTDELGGLPRPVVDPDLHRGDRRTPGDTHHRVLAVVPHDLGRCRLEPVVANGRERPVEVAVRELLLADADVVPGHEPTHKPLIPHLDPVEPLDVGHAVPAGSDQPDRKAVLGWQRAAVHVVTEEVLLVHRVRDRHAAGELLGDRQVETTAIVGDDRARHARAGDAGVVADGHASAVRAPEHDLRGLVLDARLPQQWRQWRTCPAGVPDATDEERQPGVARALEREVNGATGAVLEIGERERHGVIDESVDDQAVLSGVDRRQLVVLDREEVVARSAERVERLPLQEVPDDALRRRRHGVRLI